MDKRARRRDCFARIKALSDTEKAKHSAAIIDSLERSETFANSGTVFAFIALPSEPDLENLFAGNPQKRWAFSRIDEAGRIGFHFVENRDQLRQGAYGLREPDPDKCPLASPGSAELILVPGVSFDIANGARLGRGKGHYDRYLGQISHRPPLIGICFSTQISSLVPEDHDIPMDGVVNETGWHISAAPGR